ncbi:MAG TPA: SDR family oxidoreductase [Gemmatimonadales bacterium]|nr:SDR family oxidoreductase [Gemmatimonadales bacterium]
MDLGLKGRVALVCGGTRGIGRAVANLLAEEGAQVAVNGRDAKTAPFPADVTVPAQAEQLVQDVAKKFGRLDVLFCNAGGPAAASFKDQPADAWRKAIELNLLSSIHLARAAVPIMSKAKWGRIICLASVAALQPLPGLILSSTARAGVLGFAKALADEVATDGITVNSICPGFIDTERIKELTKARPEMMQQRIAEIPMHRVGTPEELAAAVVFLASARASYITGAVLQVDGGFIRSIF